MYPLEIHFGTIFSGNLTCDCKTQIVATFVASAQLYHALTVMVAVWLQQKNSVTIVRLDIVVDIIVCDNVFYLTLLNLKKTFPNLYQVL